MRDRQRTKMERDILADLDHPFIVGLHYGGSLLRVGIICCSLSSFFFIIDASLTVWHLCCVPFNWWTRDHETVITSSWLANGTHIFPRSSILSPCSEALQLTFLLISSIMAIWYGQTTKILLNAIKILKNDRFMASLIIIIHHHL